VAWVLTKGLSTVRDEFNRVFPGRDRGSDGTIGNQVHSTGVSGHNPDRSGRAEYRDGDAKDEVRALDLDKDLRSTVTMEQVVQHIVRRARSGIYVPFRYIIFNGRIWSRSTGWATRKYNGANRHDKHVHFSGDYTQKADEWTGSLGLSALTGGDDDMLVTEGDSGEQVKFWQHALTALGYSPGKVDGYYRSQTAAAIERFRRDRGVTKQYDYLTGWTAFAILRDLAASYAGKPGRDGKNGAPGSPGKDGTLTGALEVTGGTLTVRAVEEEA
jgi:hypothetical protein